MSRTPLAVLAFVAGFTAYLLAVLWLADRVAALHWTIQAVFFVAAGLLWVLPTRALMFWAARK